MDWPVVISLALVSLLLIGLVAGIVQAAAGTSPRSERPEVGETPASGMLGDLMDVFQPQRTSTTEEKERRHGDIVQRPDEGEPFDVDLDQGTATLRSRAPVQPS